MTYSINYISMLEHVGTHVDAPFHIGENGATIDEVPLDWFTGKAVCLDLRHIPDLGAIDVAEIEEAEDKAGVKIDGHIVLLCTGFHARHWPEREVVTKNPGITTEASHWLADRSRVHGVEGPSTDIGGTKEFPNHRVCRDRGMIHYEWLVNLEQLAREGRVPVHRLSAQVGRGARARRCARWQSCRRELLSRSVGRRRSGWESRASLRRSSPGRGSTISLTRSWTSLASPASTSSAPVWAATRRGSGSSISSWRRSSAAVGSRRRSSVTAAQGLGPGRRLRERQPGVRARLRGHAPLRAPPRLCDDCRRPGGGEELRAPGRDLVAAIVLGYEVGGRIAIAIQPTAERGAQVWGRDTTPFLRRSPPASCSGSTRRARVALGIAAIYSCVPSVYKYFGPCRSTRGRSARSSWAGAGSAWRALLAAMSVRRGFARRSRHPRRRAGLLDDGRLRSLRLRADGGRPGRALADPGDGVQDPSLDRGQPPGFLGNQGLSWRSTTSRPEDVEEVTVTTLWADLLGDSAPGSAVDAQFSLPYTVAATILREPLGPGLYADEKLDDPALAAARPRPARHDRPPTERSSRSSGSSRPSRSGSRTAAQSAAGSSFRGTSPPTASPRSRRSSRISPGSSGRRKARAAAGGP